MPLLYPRNHQNHHKDNNKLYLEIKIMKKVLSILIIGVAILFLLSFIPSNTTVSDKLIGDGDSYALTVPAKPPKPPQK